MPSCRRCRPVQAFLVPDIGVGPNEAPEFAAMARKAVSIMSLEEVLGRMVMEITVVWVLSGVVRALVDKFGDAAQKVTHRGLAASHMRALCDTLGRDVVCLRTHSLAAASTETHQCTGRCCSEGSMAAHQTVRIILRSAEAYPGKAVAFAELGLLL